MGQGIIDFHAGDLGYLVRKPNITRVQIDGEHRAFLNLWYYCRYHLVLPKVSRKGLPLQESVDGDNNRTPVIF
jgi:hypothetical protein